MLDKFTLIAKSLVADARTIAESIKNKEIGNTHLVQAMIRQPESLAYKLIVETNTPWIVIDREMESCLTESTGEGGKISGFDECFKKALEKAYMRIESSGSNWISSGSLLLGIIESETPILSKILSGWGLTTDFMVDQLRKAGDLDQNETIHPIDVTDVSILENSKRCTEDLLKVMGHAQELSRTYENSEVNFHHLLLSYVFLSLRGIINPIPLDGSTFDLEATKAIAADKLATPDKSSDNSIVFSKDVVRVLKTASLEAYHHSRDELGLQYLALGMMICNPEDTAKSLRYDYISLRKAMIPQTANLQVPRTTQSHQNASASSVPSVAYPHPQISLRRYNTDKGAVIMIPQELAEEWGVLALNITQNVMTVAMVDPTQTEVIKKLRELTGKDIAVIRAEERDLRAAFKMNY